MLFKNPLNPNMRKTLAPNLELNARPIRTPPIFRVNVEYFEKISHFG
jgi:hypothetical protein